MSNKKVQQRLERAAKEQAARDAGANDKVFMRFSENKFYNDLTIPQFEAGKVYELTGADWIQRWLKRGGVIVEKEEIKGKPEVKAQPESVSDGGLSFPLGEASKPVVEEKPEEIPEEKSSEEKENIGEDKADEDFLE